MLRLCCVRPFIGRSLGSTVSPLEEIRPECIQCLRIVAHLVLVVLRAQMGALADRPTVLCGGCHYAILVTDVASGKANGVIGMMCRLTDATERAELATQGICCLVADAVALQRGNHPLPFESPWRRHDYFGPCSIKSSPWEPTRDAVGQGRMGELYLLGNKKLHI